MSAICGMVDWRGGPAGSAVRRALDALALHGRDGEGLWDGGDAALGWRRTIITAEDRADQQPLVGGGERFRLVFDGRIDNRDELARALGLPPERERPDSAYVLAAYEKWGEGCVPHLLGDFAFAVWDGTKRTLFLTRDQVGIRPLYYFRGPRVLMFATAPSALFSNPAVPRAIDNEAFLLSLALTRLAEDETIYRDIARVPVGKCLTFSSNAIGRTEHWQPENLPKIAYKENDEYVEAFQHILDEAIRARLRTIHPVGSHLSAGWDSSTVTATAARLLAERNQRIAAFTAVPPEGWQPSRPSRHFADEGPMAAAVAARFANVDHVLVQSSGRFDFASSDHHADTFESPLRDLLNGDWRDAMHRQARQRGIRVMLSGGMGNRTLSYDGLGLLPYLLRQGRLFELISECRAVHRTTGIKYRGLAEMTFGPYLPLWLWERVDELTGQPNKVREALFGINADALSTKRLRAVAHSRTRFGPPFRRGDDRQAFFVSTQVSDLGPVWGGALAAYDLEILDPLGDRRVMAFRAGLSERHFLRRGETKRLARRAMAGVLPDALLNERSRGRQAADWYEAATASRTVLAQEVGRLKTDSLASALFDLKALENLVENWPARPTQGQESTYYRLMFVVGSARFMRRFNALGPIS